jgi:hypothetical protein
MISYLLGLHCGIGFLAFLRALTPFVVKIHAWDSFRGSLSCTSTTAKVLLQAQIAGIFHVLAHPIIETGAIAQPSFPDPLTTNCLLWIRILSREFLWPSSSRKS